MKKLKDINTWIFDLDNTLYNSDVGIMNQMGVKIRAFIMEHFSKSHAEAEKLSHHLWKKHGLTLNGLMKEYDIDANKYLQYVHDLDITKLQKCEITNKHLSRLNGRKILFTNSTRFHTDRLLKKMGMEDHFADNIFAIEDANLIPKPQLDPYHTIIEKFDINPQQSCMFEDTANNLKPAAELGMKTIFIHGDKPAADTKELPYIHYNSKNLIDILKNIP